MDKDPRKRIGTRAGYKEIVVNQALSSARPDNILAHKVRNIFINFNRQLLHFSQRYQDQMILQTLMIFILILK
ncbi:MAG: hypothetical protein MJ252_07005 [archaeon]|nr:hypothetical protein [archaeon]